MGTGRNDKKLISKPKGVFMHGSFIYVCRKTSLHFLTIFSGCNMKAKVPPSGERWRVMSVDCIWSCRSIRNEKRSVCPLLVPVFSSTPS